MTHKSLDLNHRLPPDVPAKKCEADAFDSDMIQVKWCMVINSRFWAKHADGKRQVI